MLDGQEVVTLSPLQTHISVGRGEWKSSSKKNEDFRKYKKSTADNYSSSSSFIMLN